LLYPAGISDIGWDHQGSPTTGFDIGGRGGKSTLSSRQQRHGAPASTIRSGHGSPNTPARSCHDHHLRGHFTF
jgi:hypothetical protein